MKIKAGKMERIPSQYSDELYKIIQSMMEIDHLKRPNVEDLMQHPKISKVIKELAFKDVCSGIKRKEADLQKRDEDLKIREE